MRPRSFIMRAWPLYFKPRSSDRIRHLTSPLRARWRNIRFMRASRMSNGPELRQVRLPCRHGCDCRYCLVLVLSVKNRSPATRRLRWRRCQVYLDCQNNGETHDLDHPNARRNLRRARNQRLLASRILTLEAFVRLWPPARAPSTTAGRALAFRAPRCPATVKQSRAPGR